MRFVLRCYRDFDKKSDSQYIQCVMMCSGLDLLCQLSREICSLMGVVPSDILPKRRLEKKSADLEDLRLGGVVEASHEPVAHYEVDGAFT